MMPVSPPFGAPARPTSPNAAPRHSRLAFGLRTPEHAKIARAWASPPSGRPGRRRVVPGHHVEMRPRHVVGHELLQVERRGDGAAEGAARDVVDVGHLAVEQPAIGLRTSGMRHIGSVTASPEAIRPLASSSSLQNSAGRSVPSDTRAAPVRVAQSTIMVGFSDAPSCSASHRISRPSASVLPISTVMPLRVGTTSSGRKALPDTLFSTAGTSSRSRTGSLRRHHHRGHRHHRRRAAHVLLHVEHAGRGLEIEAAGVEAHALADQRHLGIARPCPR